MQFDSLNPYHLDVLKEITNISTGTSVSRLSEYIDEKIHMSVPSVEILKFEEVFRSIGDREEEVYTVFSRFYGEIEGNSFFFFKKEDIERLATTLKHKMDSFFLLTKISQITSDSFVEALTEFTELKIEQEAPQITFDMLGAIIEQGLIEYSELADEVIFITNSFSLDKHSLEGHFLLFPSPAHLQTLFNKLGIPYGSD
ncbi:hypothetical protein CN918_32165 [Priestia megaterium]|nr:hypothetical protein CN918_32165 [Priestia megaterium]